jgi:hypothetical protein
VIGRESQDDHRTDSPTLREHTGAGFPVVQRGRGHENGVVKMVQIKAFPVDVEVMVPSRPYSTYRAGVLASN